MDEDHGPHTALPSYDPTQQQQQQRRSFGARLRSAKKAFTTRDGILGQYDYRYLFRPSLPFMKRSGPNASPFFGLHDKMPVVLALLLGLQHALAMLAGVITPPLILSGSGGANLPQDQQQYLVSASLIASGLMSCIQIKRFHIWKTPYYIGTGLISVVGVSFATLPIAQGGLAQMYDNGFCPSDADGRPLPCPRGYGAIIGTCAVCSLLEIAISFVPPKYLLRAFPPIVTGPTVMLIGVKLIQSGFQNWMGGSGLCSDRDAPDFFALCPDITAPHALPWGSPEFLGLGFSVFVTIILCERFGSPIMKSTSVIIGLVVGCIIAAATGYFDSAGIDSAPVASFIWVHTFPLSIYGPLVLPILAVYIICATEAIGDITATCDLSRVEVQGPIYETRIQGGILADGFNGLLAALCTLTPMATFAQNNGVIALTRCANRKAGYACCFFLVIMGVFAKFAAALVAIPGAVLGGMTTFLFCAVAVSGMAIISRGGPFTRRTRFILTAGLALGYGATLQPNYFSEVFSYTGDNRALQGLLDAVSLVMQTGYAVCAAICLLLNLFLPSEMEAEEDVSSSVVETTATGPQVGSRRGLGYGKGVEGEPSETGEEDGEKGGVQMSRGEEIRPVVGSSEASFKGDKQV